MDDIFYIDADASPDVLCKKFSDNENIAGIICGAGSPIEAIPNNLRIEGSLYLQRCNNLVTMPQTITVSDCLSLNNCKNLKQLPKVLNISGDLDLSNTNITCLDSKRIMVGETLSLNGCQNLTSIPGTNVLSVKRILMDSDTYQRIKKNSKKNSKWNKAFNKQKDKIFINLGESYTEISAAEWEALPQKGQNLDLRPELKPEPKPVFGCYTMGYQQSVPENHSTKKPPETKKNRWLLPLVLGVSTSAFVIVMLQQVFWIACVYLCSAHSPETFLLNGNVVFVEKNFKYQLLSACLMGKELCSQIFLFAMFCLLIYLLVSSVFKKRLEHNMSDNLDVICKILKRIGDCVIRVAWTFGVYWVAFTTITMYFHATHISS